MFEQRVKIKLSRPKNFLLPYSFLLFLILCTAMEGISRSSLVQKHIPYQAYGTNHTQMEIQLTNLDAFVRKHGEPDCFVFGSSQAFRDVDTQAFSTAFEASGGGHFTCYNFGVTGSQVATTAVLNKILIEKYRPRLVIIGTSFLDYTEGRELQIDERFTKNDWLDYETGGFSVSGWLMEHSYAWRAITLYSYSASYGMNFTEVLREAHKWDGEIAPSGFALSEVAIDPSVPVEDGFVKNLQSEFGNFGESKRNLSALEQIIIDSQSVGAHTLVVEMPFHPALLDLKDNRGKPRIDRNAILDFQERINERIDAIASSHQVPFLKIQPSLAIPDNDWFDLYHLNRNGARLFSQWLGDQASSLVALILQNQ